MQQQPLHQEAQRQGGCSYDPLAVMMPSASFCSPLLSLQYMCLCVYVCMRVCVCLCVCLCVCVCVCVCVCQIVCAYAIMRVCTCVCIYTYV